jgi:hypothetical protein
MKGEKYEIKNPFTINVGSGDRLAAQYFNCPTSSCRRSASKSLLKQDSERFLWIQDGNH